MFLFTINLFTIYNLGLGTGEGKGKRKEQD